MPVIHFQCQIDVSGRFLQVAGTQKRCCKPAKTRHRRHMRVKLQLEITGTSWKWSLSELNTAKSLYGRPFTRLQGTAIISLVCHLLIKLNAARWSPPSRTRPCIELSRSISFPPIRIDRADDGIGGLFVHSLNASMHQCNIQAA